MRSTLLRLSKHSKSKMASKSKLCTRTSRKFQKNLKNCRPELFICTRSLKLRFINKNCQEIVIFQTSIKIDFAMSDESSELLDLIVNSDSEIELDSGRSLADQTEWCPSDPERPLTPLPPPILESAKVS